ncbi:MAG: hypothetical protein KAU01_09070 [Candidatus Cloacimonetes bacterium]|nr:hypothetical protein [Candidatus Cloacimonadota bacterium]
MFLKKVLILAFIIILASCSLDRSNPLDPSNSGIQAPGKVTGIKVTINDFNYIDISWNPMINVDGFYIYRSQSFDGLYSILEDYITSPTDSLFEDQNVIIQYNYYYYRMSAFINVGGKKLEGYRSEPKSW